MQDEEQRRDLHGDEGLEQPHSTNGPSTNEKLSGAPSDEPDESEDPLFAPPEHLQLSPAEVARETALCSQTLQRIERMILVAGVASAAAAVWPLGWAVAGGVLLGTSLGWLNFRWLAASVNAIADRIVKAHSRERGAVVMLRGVGRIGLIALLAYGIFECSVRGLMGFLAGLAMPVIAMMCEAAYEFVVSIRRPS